jgi:AGZA family xanthine/uracil permease-like MFS transporter
MVDSLSISIGALMGTPPVTAFIESGAGIGEGGKTGLTAMFTGICFFISIFFAPIFASIPPWATGCVLILVGSMMVKSVVDINWKYIGDSIPAFVTIMLMPFAYSIADGLIGGICCYIVINVTVWIIKVASGGRIVPPNYHEKEPWTWRVQGGLLPPWLIRAAGGKKDFWREDARSVSDAVPVASAPVEEPESVAIKIAADPKNSGSEPAVSEKGQEAEAKPKDV